MYNPSAESDFTAIPVPAGNIRTYVLRAGRATPAQRRSYESLSGQCIIPFENKPLDFSEIFGNTNPVIVEIGFGMGEATAIIAAKNPEKNYLGIEVHKPGIGKLLWEIEQQSLGNLKIIEHDAVEVIAKMIPHNSLEGIHLFFPDPWPKKRHHKRRLVKRPFTDILAEKLKPGGYLYMVTDWEQYAEWALAELGATKGLANTAEGFAVPQDWRPRTSFERKGLAKNHIVRELLFKREKYEERAAD
jgi:tRNA (guanine-N7-)-methyltransferase